MKALKISLLLVTLLLLTSCINNSNFPSNPNSLIGKEWILEKIVNSNVPYHKATLHFENQTIYGGHSGCNLYGGKYIVNRNNIHFMPKTTTIMACVPNSVMDFEALFRSNLVSSNRYKIINSKLILLKNNQPKLIFH